MKKLLVLLMVLILTACSSPVRLESKAPAISVQEAAPAEPSATPAPQLLPSSTPTEVKAEPLNPLPSPTATQKASPQPKATEPPQPQAVGPEAFPQGYNPLTGLEVEDPALLNLPPALVSISNFPVTARPQAGLSFAPFVFEMYIGEGMTRFLALFYGDFPHQVNPEDSGSTLTQFDEEGIGPVRSGRLPYESIRQLYSGFVVMASAYQAVGAKLGNSSNVYGKDEGDINSAMIDVSKLKDIAQANATGQTHANLSGNLYSTQPSDGGEEATRLWVFYSFLNQVNWQYEAGTEAYLRAQDNADGSGVFTPSTDRLTGKQLAFENVIVLFTPHYTFNSEKTLIDVDLLYTGGNAFLFRDGKAYPIYWSTMNGGYEKSTGRLRPIRFTDREGNPIALKPGQTWVEMVDTTASIETVEPGFWKVRFYAP